MMNLGERYVKELAGAGQDHDPSLAPFAKGWVGLQEQSGLRPDVYLQNFSSDLQDVLHNYGINYDGSALAWLYDDYANRFAKTHPNSVTAKMLATHSFIRKRNLFENRQDDEDGLPLVLYMGSLGTTLYHVTRSKGAEAALERLHQQPLDEQIKSLLHKELDRPIMFNMAKGHGVERLVNQAGFASSDIATAALRAAFDHRLLSKATRTKDNERQAAIESIIQFASTPTAREQMLGFVAVRNNAIKVGKKVRSRPGASYQTPASREYLHDIIRKRELKQHEEYMQYLEEQIRQTQLRQEELLRKLRAKYGDGFYKRGSSDRTYAPSSEQATMDERVAAVIRNAHHSVRGTLSRTNHQTLEAVIAQIDALRSTDPEINVRKIIGHFHYKGQLAEASEEDIEEAKVIHLLTTVDKGQPSRLCI